MTTFGRNARFFLFAVREQMRKGECAKTHPGKIRQREIALRHEGKSSIKRTLMIGLL